MLIPSLLLKKLYTLGSLKNTPAGVEFAIKNRLSDAELVGLVRIAVDGRDVPLSGLRLTMEDGRVLTPGQITPAQPLGFPLRAVVNVRADIPALADGKHTLAITFESRPFGKLQFSVEDAISEACEECVRIPRAPADDYAPEIIAAAAGVRRADSPASSCNTSRATPSTRTWRRATAKTSLGSPRCRWGSPARCASTASTPRAIT